MGDTAQIQQSGYFVVNGKTKRKDKKKKATEILIQLYDNEGLKVDSLFYVIDQSVNSKGKDYLVIEKIYPKKETTKENLHLSFNSSPGKVNYITLLKKSEATSFWNIWTILSLILSLVLTFTAIKFFINRRR